MNFNYPEFLSGENNPGSGKKFTGFNRKNSSDGVAPSADKNSLLLKKLENIEGNLLMGNAPPGFDQGRKDPLSNSPFSPTFGAKAHVDSFNLPSELRGGVGNISSRRPSYAAESITRLSGFGDSSFYNSNNLASLAVLNSISQNPNLPPVNLNGLSDGFSDLSINSGLDDFQSRRPSQLVDYHNDAPMAEILANGPRGRPATGRSGTGTSAGTGSSTTTGSSAATGSSVGTGTSSATTPSSSGASGSAGSSSASVPVASIFQEPARPTPVGQGIKLENGLILKGQYIVASPELKKLHLKTMKYFQNPDLCNQILTKINRLVTDAVVLKLIQFVKNLNNLTFNHKLLCLVVNKNGKCDLLSYPDNSNIFLQKNDLVIVDGDRGKDLVMILEPLVSLNFAILFNYLKKLEHLKSLSINDENHTKAGTHSTELNASDIVNSHSNEDNEFIITLPTKQVLRFATPKEIHKISGKFLEEKRAFTTCHNKIKELNLQNDLTLVNVEYQSDFKKLIFYYFANFKRIDFRGLIKELFKIYKTRIWLCALLPYDSPESYHESIPVYVKPESATNKFPKEYELTNDQILNFSINEFENLAVSTYFHSINLLNLIDLMEKELKGNFYGFATEGASENLRLSNKIASPKNIMPSFNPFND